MGDYRDLPFRLLVFIAIADEETVKYIIEKTEVENSFVCMFFSVLF